jgi:protein SMG6
MRPRQQLQLQQPQQHDSRPADAAVYIQEHTEHLPAYPSRGPRGHLFDPRKDDPLRFTALTRASQSATAPSSQPSSVVDQSSMSSYTSSTAWTLTSNTTASSSSSHPPNRHPPRDGETGVFMNTLKTIYREISDAEKKLSALDAVLRPDPDDPPPLVIAMLKPGESTPNASDAESERWKTVVDRHKAYVHPAFHPHSD